MEFLLLWLDDLDDIVSSVALLGERLRRTALNFLAMVLALTVIALAAALAQYSPPFALALACLLTVTLLYNGTVAGQAQRITD